MDNQFTLIDSGIFLNKTTFFIPSTNLSLLGLLNSKLIKYFLSNIVSKMRGGYFSLSKAYVELTPVCLKEDDNTLATIVEEIFRLKKGNQKSDISCLEKQIDQFVYGLYGLTDNEIEIVETSL